MESLAVTWKGSQGDKGTRVAGSVETEDRQREKGREVWDKIWTTKEKEPEEAKGMTGRGQRNDRKRPRK